MGRLSALLRAFLSFSKYLTEIVGENRSILSSELFCFPFVSARASAMLVLLCIEGKRSFTQSILSIKSLSLVVMTSIKDGRSGDGYSEYETDKVLDDVGINDSNIK